MQLSRLALVSQFRGGEVAIQDHLNTYVHILMRDTPPPAILLQATILLVTPPRLAHPGGDASL